MLGLLRRLVKSIERDVEKMKEDLERAESASSPLITDQDVG